MHLRWIPTMGDHLIIAGHHMSLIVRSVDGGLTWTEAPMNPGMNLAGGTAAVFFINTGNPATTLHTWLWTSEGTGGRIGTWRTDNAGATWTRVDSNEHPHGQMQIYQPDSSGVVYMPGYYSALGWGVLRSTDFGQTWRHVGNTFEQAILFGTPKKVYAMYAWACGRCNLEANMQVAAVPGISGWERVQRPAAQRRPSRSLMAPTTLS